MNVKCCLLKLKYQISHADLHNTMFKQVILAWSGAHMIDDIAFKCESNWSSMLNYP